MLIRTYSKNTGIAAKEIIEFLNQVQSNSQWTGASKLTSETIQLLDAQFAISKPLALPPQEERKALPQAQSEQPVQQVEPKTAQPQTQTEQLKQPQPQEEQPQMNDSSAIQNTSNQAPLTKTELETIQVLRQSLGESAVKQFMLKREQALVVKQASVDAYTEYQRQKLYAETKKRVENDLRLQDLLYEQNVLDNQIAELNQLTATRLEQTKQYDLKVAETMNKIDFQQQEFSATLESLGLSML